MADAAQADALIERADGPPIPYATDFALRETQTLVPYARNAKDHPAAQIRGLAGALVEFGFMRPIVLDDDNTIRAGHGIVLAAELLGLTHCPSVKASHLSDAQLRAYVLADNRWAEQSTWNRDFLRIEVEELRTLNYDTEVLGFEPEELEWKDWDGEMKLADAKADKTESTTEKVVVECEKDDRDRVRVAIAAAIDALDLSGVKLR